MRGRKKVEILNKQWGKVVNNSGCRKARHKREEFMKLLKSCKKEQLI
jgi:hypothetical protein